MGQMIFLSSLFITAHHKWIQCSWNIHSFSFLCHRKGGKWCDSGCRGQLFQIQQPEMGKVRKICWNHLQFIAAYISVAAAGKMSLSLSAELDNKLAPCTSVIASKCPQVCAINYPLPMFITNSGLCTIIWLYKCSTLLCVISTIQIIPFHIFTKWPKWYVVTHYCVVFLEI